jgi:hypothetical protein
VTKSKTQANVLKNDKNFKPVCTSCKRFKISANHKTGSESCPTYVSRLQSLIQNTIYGYIDLVWYPGKNKRIAPLSFLHECRKATKGLIALIPEKDWKKTAMGLLPVTSAVFLIAN